MSRGDKQKRYTMFSITRRIELDAAHRVPDHNSKCFNIHGHRYVVEATAAGTLQEKGSARGMVMDFGFLKELMMSTIHDHCDHATIFDTHDPMVALILGSKLTRKHEFYVANYWKDLPGWKIYFMEDPPTAENLARAWYEQLAPRIEQYWIANNLEAITLEEVIVYETPNCLARYPA